MKKSLAIWLAVVLVITGMLMYQGLKPTIPDAQAVQRQGDRYVTTSSVSALPSSHRNGALRWMLAGAVARENNGQFVVDYVGATGDASNCAVSIYEKSPTSYLTLSEAYCGGTTTRMLVSNNRWGALPVTSGESYICIDNGSGVVGWAELLKTANGTEVHYAHGGGVVAFLARCSDFALGPNLANNTGQPDLSGTTFPAGSRVYLMKKCGQVATGLATVQRYGGDIIAITKDSPSLYTIESRRAAATTSGAGTTLEAVSGSYR